MYCQKCQTQNGESAQFCKNCGTNLHYTQEFKGKNDMSNILLIAYIIGVLILDLTQIALRELFDVWHDEQMKYVYIAVTMLRNIVFVLPALAIKDKTLKIIGIVVASLLIAYWWYSNIVFLLG